MDIQLPQKTIEMLELIKKHNGELDKLSLANYCSFDENWPRVEQLVESGLIVEEMIHFEECGQQLSRLGFFVTNEGNAFLTDYHTEKSAHFKDRIITVVISAVTSAIVAWGPSVLNWLQTLTQSPK